MVENLRIKSVALIAGMNDGTCRQILLNPQQELKLKEFVVECFRSKTVRVSNDQLCLDLISPDAVDMAH